MNRFTEAAKIAYEKIKDNQNILTKIELGDIWKQSCEEVELQESTLKKSCPKNIFISLYENGFLKECNSKDKIVINENNKLLVEILSKLKENSELEKICIRRIWKEIAGEKEYNSEIDVLRSLYKDNINKYVVINNIILFEEGVKKIHLSYSFAKDMRHFVKLEGYRDYEFYPTNFLYAFMSFNMIYDFFKEKKVNGYYNNTKERIEKSLSYLTGSEIEGIKKIEEQNQTKELKELLKGLTIRKEEIKETLYYIYSVRNNFFHGSKKTKEYLQTGQRERMYSYTNFILEFCEAFFKNLESKGLELSKGYELEDNFVSWE